MNLNEMKAKIRSEYGEREFEMLLEYGSALKFEEATGIKFERVSFERSEGSGDYDGFEWIFKLNDRTYRCDGYYSSHSGAEVDDPLDFYEVRPVEKTIIVYEKV